MAVTAGTFIFKKSLNMPSIPSSVLLARFSAIGDVAMTVPVVYSACRCYPQTRFVMLTRESMVPIFSCAPPNLTVAGIDVHADAYRGVAGMRRLAAEMRRQFSPDVFVDLHSVLRTRLLGFFLRLHGVRTARLDKARGKRRALTRPNNKLMLPLTGIRDRYALAFERAGMPLQECFDGLFGGRSCAPVESFAAITGPKPAGERWIGIAPFAAHKGKIYPERQMEQVVAALAAEPDVRIFLLGGGGHEAETLAAWADSIGHNVHCLAGKRYGFAAELALFNHLDCMLSMDSGNMHLAAIAGAPAVSVWGATHPYCGFTGWRQTEADMVQLPVPCRPCSVFGDKPCARGDYMCLRAIRPESITARVLQKLK